MSILVPFRNVLTLKLNYCVVHLFLGRGRGQKWLTEGCLQNFNQVYLEVKQNECLSGIISNVPEVFDDNKTKEIIRAACMSFTPSGQNQTTRMRRHDYALPSAYPGKHALLLVRNEFFYPPRRMMRRACGQFLGTFFHVGP